MDYSQWKTARPVTCKLLAMMEEGLIDPHELAKLALNWLSESSVAEMTTANFIQLDLDEDGQGDDDEEDADDSSEYQEDITEYDNVDDCHDEYGSRDQ